MDKRRWNVTRTLALCADLCLLLFACQDDHVGETTAGATEAGSQTNSDTRDDDATTATTAPTTADSASESGVSDTTGSSGAMSSTDSSETTSTTQTASESESATTAEATTETTETAETTGASDATGSSGMICGDGIVDGDEECDDADLNSQTCASLGFVDGGELACTAACELDASDCIECSEWTRQLGTSGKDFGYAVAFDNNGHVYVAGDTDGDLDGNIAAGGYDAFVSKYTSDGTKIWTRALGTPFWDHARGVAVDSSGGIFVVGYTSGALDNNVNAGGTDLFIAKFDSDGSKQWTRQLGTAGAETVRGVAINANDDVYVAGSTNAGLDGNAWAGGRDVFVTKYDGAGSKQWTQQFGGSEGDRGTGVAIDGDGNLLLSGYTFGDLDGVNNGLSDIIVAKLDVDGILLWVRQLGSSNYDYGSAAAVDDDDNVYVSGQAKGPVDGNPWAGTDDIIVTKYDTDGVKQWTRQLGTSGQDASEGLAVDGEGVIYVSGTTGGALDGNISAGSFDAFVTRYDDQGVKLGTTQFGTAGFEFARAVAVDDSDNLYITGETDLGLNNNPHAGGWDMFVMRTCS